MNRLAKNGVIIGLLSLICMSVAPTLNKIALFHYSPVQAVFINVIFGICFSFIFATIAKSSLPMPRVNWSLLAVVLLHGGGLLLFFYCAERLHPFSIGLAGRFYTLISVFFAVFALHEIIRRDEWLLLSISLICLSLFEYRDMSAEPMIGLICGIAYAACFSLSHLLIKTQFADASPAKILFCVNLISGMFLLIPVNLDPHPFSWHSESIALIAVASLFSSFIGTLLFYRSLALLDFASATTLRSLSPIFIAIVAAPVFPFHVSALNVSTGLLGVIALSLFTYVRAKRTVQKESEETRAQPAQNVPPIMTYYQYSNEKIVAKAALRELLSGRTFGSSLDVGSGTGDLAEVLCNASTHVTLVEKLDFYEEILKKKYPHAEIVMQSINDFPLKKYDCILYSHGLYYQPLNNWLDLCSSLYRALNPGGMLIVMMNSDSGSWWDTIKTFQDELAGSMGFNYRPWSKFSKELKKFGPHKSMPYIYKLQFPSFHELVEYKLHACLSIRNPQVKDKIRPKVREMYKDLNAKAGVFELSYESEILLLER